MVRRGIRRFVFIAPPIAVALAKSPLVDQYDHSSVRVIFSGAAPLDGQLARAVADRLHATVAQGYGLTETSPVTHAIPLGQILDAAVIGVTDGDRQEIPKAFVVRAPAPPALAASGSERRM
jgi:acyl-CoA synthetase (AMP-forming)/AMP-acid ligase II